MIASTASRSQSSKGVSVPSTFSRAAANATAKTERTLSVSIRFSAAV